MPDRALAPPRTAPCFDRLLLADVRCFARIEVPLDRHVTVIIGENGAGKTTVAEALASLSFGEREGLPEFPLRHGADTGEIALYEAGAREPVARWEAAGERKRLAEDRYLFAYGRYRRVPVEGLLDELLPVDLTTDMNAMVGRRRTTTLFKPDHGLHRDIGRVLIRLDALRGSNLDAQAAWDALQKAVQALGHGLRGVRVVERDGRDVAVVERRGTELPLNELSDGYQAMLVIVLDLVIRYAFLPPVPDPMRRPATLVIDEVDLHLHPRWQRRVVRQLHRIFPETQIILTTHSAAVVQGAIDDGHAVLVLQEKDGAVALTEVQEKARRALRGAQLGSVLVDRHLFGVASRYSRRFEATEKEARRLRRRMEAGTATAEERKGFLDALDTLEELTAKEEERWAGAPVFREITRGQIAMLAELAAATEEARRGKARP